MTTPNVNPCAACGHPESAHSLRRKDPLEAVCKQGAGIVSDCACAGFVPAAPGEPWPPEAWCIDFLDEQHHLWREPMKSKAWQSAAIAAIRAAFATLPPRPAEPVAVAPAAPPMCPMCHEWLLEWHGGCVEAMCELPHSEPHGIWHCSCGYAVHPGEPLVLKPPTAREGDCEE